MLYDPDGVVVRVSAVLRFVQTTTALCEPPQPKDNHV